MILWGDIRDGAPLLPLLPAVEDQGAIADAQRSNGSRSICVFERGNVYDVMAHTYQTNRRNGSISERQIEPLAFAIRQFHGVK